eukprot:1817358-Amphidinium_carterae.1
MHATLTNSPHKGGRSLGGVYEDGFCAFYIRCPFRVEIIVTLFVGKTKKGSVLSLMEQFHVTHGRRETRHLKKSCGEPASQMLLQC